MNLMKIHIDLEIDDNELLSSPRLLKERVYDHLRELMEDDSLDFSVKLPRTENRGVGF
jgi:hypothetical protein